MLLNADPGTHSIQVTRDGFLEPPPQKVEVRAGKQSAVSFALLPKPAPVAPAIPVSTVGKLRMEVSPAAAQIRYTRAGDSTPRSASAGVIELEEGSYVITAQAPGYEQESASVLVKSGSVQIVTLHLKPKPRQPVVRTMNPADWDRTWTQDGEWLKVQGGGPVLYRVAPAPGTYQFTLRSKGSLLSPNPKIRWVLGYTDERNYALFELDGESYSSIVYRAGKKTVRVDKKRHGIRQKYFTIRMTVDPARLLVALMDAGKTSPLDEWIHPEPGITAGRFGFYLPGNSQLWLANFSFTGPAPHN